MNCLFNDDSANGPNRDPACLPRHPAVAYLFVSLGAYCKILAMRPSRIFETVLYAEDLAAAEQFYRDAVGLEVIGRGDLSVVFQESGSG